MASLSLCTYCGKAATGSCASCLDVNYCCVGCQGKHWNAEHWYTCGKNAPWAGFEASLVAGAGFYTITQRHVALTVDVVRSSYVLHKHGGGGVGKTLDDQATAAVLAQLNQFSEQLLRATGVAGMAAAAQLKTLFTEHTVLAKTYAVQVFQGKKADAAATLDKLVNHNGKAMHEFLGGNALVKTPGIGDRIGKLFMEHLTSTAAYIGSANEQGVKSAKFWQDVWTAVEVGRQLGAALDSAYPAKV